MKSPADELIELCGAVRDETATPAQLARLEAMMSADPDARRVYRRFMQIGATLERYERTAVGDRVPMPLPGRRPAGRWVPRHPGWLALAASLVLGLALYFNSRQPAADEPGRGGTARDDAPIAYVQEAYGCVLVPRSGPPIDFKGGFQLRAGDIVRTGANGSAVLRFANESTFFVLDRDTRVWLSHENSGKIVHLASGQICGDVAPQDGGRQWRIITADGEARVLGTRLAVSALSGGTRVAVTAGRVLVTSRDSRASVETRAGFVAELTPATARLAKLPPTEPTRVLHFTVVNADDNSPVPGFERLVDGAVIDLARLPTRRLNIRANCEPQLVGTVRFALAGRGPDGQPLSLVQPLANGFPHQIEIYYPYMVAGDPSFEGETLPGYSYAWIPPVGRYTLTATPYAGVKESGARGDALTVRFEVVDSSAGN